MNKYLLHSALLGALWLGSTSAMATGFVALSEEGFDVEEGGLSAYTLCNLTGEFGSDEEGSIPPTFEPNGGANNTCAIPKIPDGYKQIKNARRPIVLNGFNRRFRPVKITIGFVTDRVWRNEAESSCIYGAKVRLNNVDADRIVPGKQFFEINDILRGGVEGRAPEIAYWFTSNADEVVYRAGLTSTSLVFEPESESEAQPLLDDAPIDENWVDFSTDLNYRDDDGSSYRDSPWLLVKTACAADENPVVLPGALKFRQMGQEGQPLITIEVKGFAPAGATTGTAAP
jgi:hypothetical protein